MMRIREGKTVNCAVKRSQRGFTLIEMMVTIAAGAILTSLAVPRVSEIRDTYRMRSTAQDVFLALQRARMAAVKENNQYRFSVSGTTYRLHNDLNNNGAEDAGEPVTTKNMAEEMPGIHASWWWSSSTPTQSGIMFAPNGTAPSIGGIIMWDDGWEHWSYVAVSRAGVIWID